MLLRSTVVLAEDVARPNRAGRQADMQVMDRTSNVGEASSARKKLWGISATRHDFEGKWQRWQTADGQESEAQQAGVPMHGWTIIRPPHIVVQRWLVCCGRLLLCTPRETATLLVGLCLKAAIQPQPMENARRAHKTLYKHRLPVARNG